MPLFHFHTQTHGPRADFKGTELANHQLARTEGIRCCGAMMQEEPEAFWNTRPWTMSVTDAAGLILYEFHMDGFASPAIG